MKNYFYKIIITLLGFIFISGCKKDKIGEGVDVITVQMFQKLTANGSTLILNCSGGNFGCTNVGIKYELKIEYDNITIVFFDAYYTSYDHCIEPGNSDAPSAVANVDLGYLPNGNYNLNISNNNSTNHLILIVSDSKFKIVGSNSSTVKFYLGIMESNRIPVDALWGDISYDNSNYNKMLSFFDSLDSHGCSQFVMEPGNYGVFIVNADGSIDRSSLTIRDSSVLRKYSGNISEISDIIHTFCYPNGTLDINFYNGKGEEADCY
ncbi:MAG TPA: hypothetical protein VJY62_00100 [Bacteroidia bacterium]|nr:hypothetical protein [Bacteroidia bacterium]